LDKIPGTSKKAHYKLDLSIQAGLLQMQDPSKLTTERGQFITKSSKVLSKQTYKILIVKNLF